MQTLSERTVDILKNFSAINPSIVVKRGNKLRTISNQKSTMAEAVIDDHFENSFALYDLNQFLAAVSLFDQPEFDFEDESSVRIVEGDASIRYFFADSNMITVPPDNAIELKADDIEVEFVLPAAVLKACLKASSVLQVPNINVIGNGKSITVTVTDAKNPTSNYYSYVVGETSDSYEKTFRVENMKLMDADYNVNISKSGVGHFFTANNELAYWVAVEATL